MPTTWPAHAAAALIRAPSIVEARFSSQSLIHSFESCSEHLSALRLPPSETLFVPHPSQKVGEPELAGRDRGL